ncbi:MAG: citrate synthase protein [Hyphomicrobiales bacterium]|nr:citrate synthase protein [Hyphomicrobiales bacterium]
MKDGLEDVIAAQTMLSDVDGNAGRLVIRGHTLDDLVQSSSFEDVAHLLFADLFPDLPDAAALAAALGSARTKIFRHLAAIDPALLTLSPVAAIRALMARIDDGNDLVTALQLLAAPAVFTAAIIRLRRSQQAIAPDATLSQAADFLRMASGRPPTAEQTAALNTYLVTVSDHGLNASTFAARVVASTGAGLTSSSLAALGALSGPLHGGAPGPVLDMLDAIGNPRDAEPWLEAALARGERLMGFGHRIYRVRDPRADALKGALRALAASGQVVEGRTELAEAVEAAALSLLKRKKPDRPLDTNVEFYTALLLEALGFPRETFTCVFAVGRSAGWIAHTREQALHGRLMRPQSLYIGPATKVPHS